MDNQNIIQILAREIVNNVEGCSIAFHGQGNVEVFFSHIDKEFSYLVNNGLALTDTPALISMAED